MVTLNFTLLVELGLFLLFLWGTHVFFLKPILRQIDRREDAIVHDQEQSVKMASVVAELEKTYTDTVTAFRREEEEAFRTARRDALEEFQKRVAAQRSESRAELDAARAALAADMDAQREQFPELSRQISEAVAARLGVRGSAS